MENGLAGIWGEEIAGAGEYLRAGEIPGRSTGDPGRVPLSLQKNAKGGGQDCSSGSLIVKCNAPGWDVRCGK